MRAGAESPVRIGHVLFDADGVIQEIPGGWYAAMEPYLGERSREFLHRTWKEELPTLSGRGDYRPMLEATLAEFGVSTPVDEVIADVWHRIAVDETSLRIVARLRERGYGVHLGSNQERHRAAHMTGPLRYRELFDVVCISCELGVAKPDPEFFLEAARRIGAEPAHVLFIDDSTRNVEAARTVGMASERWELGEGHDRLIELLRHHGIEAAK